MNEDLKRLEELIDELEAEVWRQNQRTLDPKLKEWCRVQATTLARMEEELETYVEKVEAAGDDE